MIQSEESCCQYCFGAGKLTKSGRFSVPCHVCMGGTLKGEELAKANMIYLKKLEEVEQLIREDDNQFDNQSEDSY